MPGRLTCLATLCAVHVCLALFGFQRVLRSVLSCRAPAAAEHNPAELMVRLSARIDEAAVWYPFDARCLERSLCLVLLGRVEPERVEIGDRLDLFEGRRAYDEEFIATFVTEHGTCPNRTVWSDVQPVPAGSVVCWRDGRQQLQPFWTAASIAPRNDLAFEEAAQCFRDLLHRAVLNRLDGGGRTWAQLSGGLDSSSVVSTAASAASGGKLALGGTVTFTDSLGNGDESTFVDAVIRHYVLRNLTIHDEWPWRDDGEPPPITDQPARDYPFYARDRRLGAVVAAVQAWSLPRQWSGSHVSQGAGRSTRVGRYLLPCQIALSVLLVFTAGLLIRTFQNLQSTDAGLKNSGRVLLMKLVPRPGGYEGLEERLYYPALAQTLSAVPGVAGVSFSQLFPAVANEVALYKPIRSAEDPSAVQNAVIDVVSPHFFETIGITRLSGRDLTWNDGDRTQGVAVLNAVLERRLFGAGNSVGRLVVVGTGAQEEAVEVVGVVATATMGNLRSREVPVVYRPTLQGRRSAHSPFVEIRTYGDPRAIAAVARRTIESFGREYPLTTHTLDGYIDRSLARERATAGVASAFGGFALLLACAGIYAQIAHGVTRRTREIGVRLALGASRGSVVRAVTRDGIMVVVVGFAIGLPPAIALARVWKSVLFEVAPADLTTIAIVTLGFIAAAGGAASVPARRASTIEPMVALRSE